jgi:DNA-3-methyladenine glycosylase I
MEEREPERGLRPAGAGRRRCAWCGTDPLYVAYHDTEWGLPLRDERRLFEKMCLEGFQSGLAWLTILRKRERFRRVFLDFDWRALARRGEPFVARALQDAGIVRHRGKIESVLNNARRACAAEEAHGGLAAWWWSFAPPPARAFGGIRPSTPESAALSKELKRAGWSYVGPTTVHAMMQATGMVNDHLPGCFARARCASARRMMKDS